MTWQPISTAPRKDRAMFWVRVRTVKDPHFTDTDGRPILAAQDLPPYVHIGPYGSWSSLSMATHWMPIPTAPE
jgi:hypothetical protein